MIEEDADAPCKMKEVLVDVSTYPEADPAIGIQI